MVKGFNAGKFERDVKKEITKRGKEVNKDLDKLARGAGGKSKTTVERELKKIYEKHGFEVDRKTLREQAEEITEE